MRRICAGRFPKIEGQALRNCWDTMRTELEVLRSTRPRSPRIGSGDSGVNGAVLEVACLLIAKLAGPEGLYPEQPLDAAASYSLAASGRRTCCQGRPGLTATPAETSATITVLGCALGRGIEAAFSTVDIGSILPDAANRSLLDGLFSVERAWRTICAVHYVSDLETVTSERLTGKDQHELVAPDSKLRHV